MTSAPESPVPPGTGAVLTIDLDALKANYRLLAETVRPAGCAAAVKAEAYGLGAEAAGPALADAGARDFFVALPAEGQRLRQALADHSEAQSIRIYVLNGPMGAPEELLRADLIPVLNSLEDVEAWSAAARAHERRLPAALHVDTGMSRLGLPRDELERLAEQPERLAGIDVRLILSHLACAEERGSEMNPRQLVELKDALTRLPAAPVSFANSSGIFLGPDYHFDLARPGVALYGVNPTPDAPNPMRPVVRLDGRILQVRAIDAPRSVGYGASHRVAGPTLIATVAVGYADGYPRSLSGRALAAIEGQRVPVVGRVSMDLITLDVSTLPEVKVRPGQWAELIGPTVTVDEVAEAAGTIGYEILTSLGPRYYRRYLGG